MLHGNGVVWGEEARLIGGGGCSEGVGLHGGSVDMDDLWDGGSCVADTRRVVSEWVGEVVGGATGRLVGGIKRR